LTYPQKAIKGAIIPSKKGEKQEKCAFFHEKWGKSAFFLKKVSKNFGGSEKSSTFALAFRGTLLVNEGNKRK